MSARKLAGYLVLSWVPHAIAYVVAPNAIAAVGQRFGASVGPGPWSVAGIPFVAAGAFMIAWAISGHYRESPDELQITARPTYLTTSGAYSISRNPLYVGGAFLWAGWAVAWLSLAVLGFGALLFGFLALIGVPYEERLLRERHGALYDDYRNAVPRWLQLRRAGPARR